MRRVQDGSLAYYSARNGIRRSGPEAIAGPNAHISCHSRTPDRPRRHPQLMPCAHSSHKGAGIQAAPIVGFEECFSSRQQPGIHSRRRTAWQRDLDGLLSKPHGSPLQPRVAGRHGNAATATARLRLTQQVRRLGDIHSDASFPMPPPFGTGVSATLTPYTFNHRQRRAARHR